MLGKRLQLSLAIPSPCTAQLVKAQPPDSPVLICHRVRLPQAVDYRGNARCSFTFFGYLFRDLLLIAIIPEPEDPTVRFCT